MRMSIIIPVRNGAATLGRCLDSILAQTFGDWQTVIVDDGSTDESAAVAARYAERDGRFLLVRAVHKGAGGARNVGLQYARGEYILHMDADDYWIRGDLLAELEERIRKEPADVYMYRMSKVKENGEVLARFEKPVFDRADQVVPLADVYQDLVRDGHTLAAAWNKCVRREILTDRGIRFREDVLGEDIDWVLQLFSHVETVCLLNIRAYAYTQHRTVSRSTRADAPNDLVTIVCDWAEWLAHEKTSHTQAVAGVLAFEYGICMGNFHRLSAENRRLMKENMALLDRGLDRKTRMIGRFCGMFGFRAACFAIRVYLVLRRIW